MAPFRSLALMVSVASAAPSPGVMLRGALAGNNTTYSVQEDHPRAFVSASANRIECGENMHVSTTQCGRYSQVQGITGGRDTWYDSCMRCGNHLQKNGKMASGDFGCTLMATHGMTLVPPCPKGCDQFRMTCGSITYKEKNYGIWLQPSLAVHNKCDIIERKGCGPLNLFKVVGIPDKASWEDACEKCKSHFVKAGKAKDNLKCINYKAQGISVFQDC